MQRREGAVYVPPPGGILGKILNLFGIDGHASF
jgi:hypothetical protein